MTVHVAPSKCMSLPARPHEMLGVMEPRPVTQTSFAARACTFHSPLTCADVGGVNATVQDVPSQWSTFVPLMPTAQASVGVRPYTPFSWNETGDATPAHRLPFQCEIA